MANYYDSEFGIGLFLHVNKPDRGIPGKFDTNPTFKVDLALDGDEALAMKEKVDAQSEAAFENFKETDQFKNMKPKDQRALTVYYPYEEEEDDDGNKTGRIIFHFRQNAKIKLKDGTFKDITIGIYDAKGKEMNKLVRSGSELRVKYAFRPIKAPTTPPGYGVRLDFMGVQIKKLATGNSSGGFGAVDGYVDDGTAGPTSAENEEPDTQSNDADY